MIDDEACIQENDYDEGSSQKKQKLDIQKKTAKKKKFQGFKEDPFILLPSSHKSVQKICDTYGLSDEFPRDLFVVRTEPEKDDFSNLYIVSEKVKETLLDCDKLRVVNCGVKLFKKHGGETFEDTCPYRGMFITVNFVSV